MSNPIPLPIRCGKCGSAEIKSFEMIHAAGPSWGAFGSAGIPQQLQLAMRVSAPQMPIPKGTTGYTVGVITLLLSTLVGIFIRIGLSSTIGSGFSFLVGFLVWISAPVAATYISVNHRKKVDARAFAGYQADLEEWRHRWMCLRCGLYFKG